MTVVSLCLLSSVFMRVPCLVRFGEHTGLGYALQISCRILKSEKGSFDRVRYCILTIDFVELSGDGCVAIDPCLRGSVAKFQGVACVVMGCTKGHTPGDMEKANCGMPSPAGYRTALRLFQLAERFHLPFITFVDTPGAWPSFPRRNVDNLRLSRRI